MSDRIVAISLSEPDIQRIEEAVLDRNAALALEVLETIVHPKVQAYLERGHCRPVFEWGTSSDLRPAGPPDAPPRPPDVAPRR